MTYAAVLGFLASSWIVYQWVTFTISTRKVRDIPTVGPDGFISSYLSAWKYEFGNGKQMIQEGYEKYPGSVFKVPTLSSPNRWMIVVNGSRLIEDLRKASKEQLSFGDAFFELFQSDHLMHGPGKSVNRRDTAEYHIGVVRGPLTRGYPFRFEDIKDEISQSFSDLIPVTESWSPVKIHDVIIHIICRTTNRLFVGLPLCRDPDYCRIQETITVHLVTAGTFLALLPAAFRPVVGRLITRFPSTIKKVQDCITPLAEEIIKSKAAWEGKNGNLLSWLWEEAPEKCKTLSDLAGRLIMVNIASLHTTTQVVTDTLLELAARQEYVAPLRSEVEDAIDELGWTKEAMSKMHKLDSFIKETCRLKGLMPITVVRNARVDYRLSNGAVIPAGFRVSASASPLHTDPLVYENAESFDGYRFVGSQKDGSSNGHSQLVSLDSNYLLFGHGRAACPGRFFAVSEIKAMMAHVLLNYDFKLPNDETRAPEADWFGHHRVPNQTAEIMFRKRQSIH
ncbi:cytochrome P450 [Coprinopsis cinerea AmutBmut pab1-1]|nr:cytochrome P450 [Coprinopsis cinerea AmutBmut pab1-1]